MRHMAPKTASANKAAIQKLVEKWQKAAAFNHAKANDDTEDTGWRRGYATAAEQAAIDLLSLL